MNYRMTQKVNYPVNFKKFNQDFFKSGPKFVLSFSQGKQSRQVDKKSSQTL